MRYVEPRPQPTYSDLITEHLHGCYKDTEMLAAVLGKLDETHSVTKSDEDGPSNPGLLPLLVYQLRELRLRLDRLVQMTDRY